MADSLIEIVDTADRENYNKIVITKKKWIPVIENTSVSTDGKNENESNLDNNLTNINHLKILNIQNTELYEFLMHFKSFNVFL